MSILWRRDPESNRTDRICNPGHNRFAIAPQNPGRDSVEAGFGCPTSIKNGSRGFHFFEPGAGNEARTRDLNLGKVALYQLSYSRRSSTHCLPQLPCNPRELLCCCCTVCAEAESIERFLTLSQEFGDFFMKIAQTHRFTRDRSSPCNEQRRPKAPLSWGSRTNRDQCFSESPASGFGSATFSAGVVVAATTSSSGSACG